MSVILNQITIGDNRIILVDSAPNLGSGLTAEIGSIVMIKGQAGIFLKTGPNSTDWKLSTVDAAQLGLDLDDIQSQIDAEVEARESLSARVDQLDNGNDELLAQEIARAQAADLVLQGNIDAEANARQSADSALDSRLSVVEAREEVIEGSNLAALPAIGEISKLYVAKDSNKVYRWDSQSTPMVFDWTVGSGGNFADLQTALASASVVNGHKLKVLNGTYSVSSVINVTKEVTIVGESKAGVIFQTAGTTSDPVNMMSITANNVSLANMTFKHKKTSNTSVEAVIVASGGGYPQTRISNFVAENLHIEFCEFGIVTRGQDWTIRGCRFVYATGSASNSCRAVGIYGNKGTSYLYQNILDNSVLNGTAFRPFYLTSTTGTNPNETVEGSLYVEGTTQVGANLAQFFNMDNNQSAGAGTFNLIIKDNIISESNLFSGFSSSAANAGDMFAQVVLSGNTLSNLHAVDGGKGIFGVYGTAAFRTTALPVHASNNTLGQTTYRTGWMAVEGTIVGKETGTPAFAVALDSNIPATPTVPSVPTQVVTQAYVEVSPTDSQVTSKLNTLEANLAQEVLDRQSGDSSTLSSAQSYTDQKVANLVNSAPAVLDTLKELSDALGSDPNFATTVAGQIGVVDDRVDQEILDRIADVNAEESRALLAESGLQSQITQEIADRIADVNAEESRALLAESGLQSQISQEILDRQSGDSSTLSSAQSYTDQKVADLVNSAPTVLDTLKELSDALGSDPNFATTIAGQIGDLDSRLDTLEGSDTTEGSVAKAEKDAKDYADGIVAAEESARQAADSAEASARQAADDALDARVLPIEKRYQVNHLAIYENNAQVYADGQPGVEDPSGQLRDGWYYTNVSAGQKINWYYFDGINNATVTLGDLSAYAVMTFDGLGSMPILGVYTKPTGSGDVIPGFAHSRVAYSGSPTGLVTGKKYLVYFGENPSVHPELPRVQLVKSTGSSAGDQNAAEEVLTVSFGSNSGASVGSVKFMTESLGIWSASYKHEVELRIRHASQLSLNNEITARIADVNAEESRALAAEAELLKLDGSRAMAGDLNMTNHYITSVGKLGLGSGAPETKFHMEEYGVKFNMSAGSNTTSGAEAQVVETLAIADDSVEMVKILVTGMDSASKDSVSYERTARIKNVGGTVTLGAVQSDYTSEDSSLSGANCAFVVDAGGVVNVQVTGVAAKNMIWKCVMHRMR